jgi:hypothetical protein
VHAIVQCAVWYGTKLQSKNPFSEGDAIPSCGTCMPTISKGDALLLLRTVIIIIITITITIIIIIAIIITINNNNNNNNDNNSKNNYTFPARRLGGGMHYQHSIAHVQHNATG